MRFIFPHSTFLWRLENDIRKCLKLPYDTGFRPYTPIEEDYKLGASGKEIIFKDGEGLEEYLPEGELQNKGREKFTCTDHASNKSLQLIFNWKIKNRPLDPVVILLKSWGGVINGKVNLSDRFDAWAAGTDGNGGGNNYKRVCDSKRHNGFLFEHEWPYVDNNTEYFKTPPTELIQLARKRADILDINYWFIAPEETIEALQYGLPATSGHAWPEPVNGIYPRVNYSFNHAFNLFKKIINVSKEAFDTYLDRDISGDFFKTLAWDYKLGWGVQFTISVKKNFLNLSEIIARYEGKAVKGSSDKCYLIRDGKKRYIPNVETGWSFGVRFEGEPVKGIDLVFKPLEWKELFLEEISDIELEMIPTGEPLSFKEGYLNGIINEVANHYYREYKK